MRKKALKKKYPNRNRIINNLRNVYPEEHIDSNGNVVYLNVIKHLAFKKPYKNSDYLAIMVRKSNEMFKKRKENSNARPTGQETS